HDQHRRVVTALQNYVNLGSIRMFSHIIKCFLGYPVKIGFDFFCRPFIFKTPGMKLRFSIELLPPVGRIRPKRRGEARNVEREGPQSPGKKIDVGLQLTRYCKQLVDWLSNTVSSA